MFKFGPYSATKIKKESQILKMLFNMTVKLRDLPCESFIGKGKAVDYTQIELSWSLVFLIASWH